VNRGLKGLAGLLVVTSLLSACGSYGPKPTPVGTLTPRPTVLPEATIGALIPFDSAPLGLSLSVPAAWKAAESADSVVISPAGTADTSYTAGPFLYIIPDAAKVLPNKLSFSFHPDVTDPAKQLDMLMESLQRDDPRFTRAKTYEGMQYPAAITTGYDRDNQLTIVLMNAGNNRWIYVGTQSIERYYSYYDVAVFQPALKSLIVK
jgi:hypothetical protein